jgi:hypothetical protein
MCIANAPSGSRQSLHAAPTRSPDGQRRGRALQVALRIDHQRRSEAREFLAQLEPRARTAASIEFDHAFESRERPHELRVLLLDHPNDARRLETRSERVIERQGVHHVAEMRQPHENDTL